MVDITKGGGVWLNLVVRGLLWAELVEGVYGRGLKESGMCDSCARVDRVLDR